MSVYNVLNTGIFSKLSGGTALISLLGGTAIYNEQAPDLQSAPFVVFSQVTGGPESIAPPDLRDQFFQVMAFASTPILAGSVDAACSTLLHRGSVTVSGYTCIYCVRDTEFTTIDTLPNGEKIYTAGADYRIRLV